MMVSTLGKKRHKTLHYIDTDETLIDMFPEDVSPASLSLALLTRLSVYRSLR